MMRYFRKFNKYCYILLFILTGCSHHTYLQPFISYEENRACGIPFINEKQRFIHVVEATLPNKATLSMIGITVASPETKQIHCVIMTIEGFVIFDALYDQGELTINRGVPPFDSKAFAQGMIDDIRLIFFKPDGILQAGILADSSHACRYTDQNQLVIDVITTQNNDWEIRQYDKDLKLMRRVKAYWDKPNKEMIPERLELTAYGENPYALKLKHLKHEKITVPDRKN